MTATYRYQSIGSELKGGTGSLRTVTRSGVSANAKASFGLNKSVARGWSQGDSKSHCSEVRLKVCPSWLKHQVQLETPNISLLQNSCKGSREP